MLSATPGTVTSGAGGFFAFGRRFSCNDRALRRQSLQAVLGGAQMNHNDLVAAVATALDLSRKQAEATIAAVLTPVTEALAKGEEVKLNGLGSFEIVDRPARPGRNPQTGAAIEIAASRSIKFKPAKALRDALSPANSETTP
jgi:DNA-binding protein HU-beta